MPEAVADIAVIGLAVMGQNLILNMNDHGFVVITNKIKNCDVYFLIPGVRLQSNCAKSDWLSRKWGEGNKDCWGQIDGGYGKVSEFGIFEELKFNH